MSFARNAANVGMATIVSRILGFARDVMVASALGAGPAADAFVVAFRLPGLLRRLFAEGAINSAFVPLFAEAGSAKTGQRLADDIASVIVAGFAALTAVAIAAMPWLVAVVAPGFEASGGAGALAVELSRITFPFCLATALMVVASALLNVHGRFAASAYAPAMVNVVTIAALLTARALGWRDEETVARLLAWAVLLGGIAQCALVIAALKRAGLTLHPAWPRLTPTVRRFFRLAFPGVAAAGITQVNAFVGLIVASPEPGAVAWLYYADRVYQLPLGIVAVAIGLTLLPDLARHSAAGDVEAERHALSRAAEFAAFLSLPAALALFIAAEPIIGVLFQRSAFSSDDTIATASALAAFAVGLPAFVGAKLLQPLFFARTRMRLPFMVAIIGVAVDVALAVLLFPSFRQIGIAAAAAASGWVNLALLGAFAWRRGYLRLDPAARVRLMRIAASGALMAAFMAALVPAVEPFTQAGPPGLVRIGALAALCLSASLIYIAACLLTGGLDRSAISAAFKPRNARDAKSAGGTRP